MHTNTNTYIVHYHLQLIHKLNKLVLTVRFQRVKIRIVPINIMYVCVCITKLQLTFLHGCYFIRFIIQQEEDYF